jgi:lysophospholipase L1-like esterase
MVETMEARALLATAPLVIASLGDSLTDEYQFYGAATAGPTMFPRLLPSADASNLPANIYLTGRDTARNYTMQIGATRSTQITYGDFTTQNRGETRNQGFQEDWAVTGAAASGPDVSGTGTTWVEEYEGSAPEFSQGEDPMPGLNTQTSPPDISIKDINVVTMLIGANDYNAALSAFTEQSDKSDTTVFATANTNIENAIANAISSIQTAAAAAGNTSVKFVVITTPNITVSPLIQDEAGSSLPALKVVIGGYIDALDANLVAAYGKNPDVGLVDSTKIINDFIANPVIDGVTVNMEGAGQNYTDGFIGDGFHPGTIVQGLVTQAIVNTINTLEGSQAVDPITDADIVNYAEDSQPTISFTSSAHTTTVGQGITFTATITPSLLHAPAVTGTVTFEEIKPATSTEPATPGLVLGTVPVNLAGKATFTFPDLRAGNYEIAALYNGDFRNVARLSAILSQTVTRSPAATTTALYTSMNPAAAGKPVTFTAVVHPSGSGLPSPSGAVTFLDQSTNRILGAALLDAKGVATLSVPQLGVGVHTIVASYGGTAMLAASASRPLAETVNPPPPVNRTSTTQLFATYSIVNGQALVTLRVVVTPANPASGPAFGQVDLQVGGYRLLTLKLNHGSASASLSLTTMARRFVSAQYTGSATLQASGSPYLYVNPHPFAAQPAVSGRSQAGPSRRR